MRYPVVHNRVLAAPVYGGPKKPASAPALENPELGKAAVELGEARAFVTRILGERPAITGILGAEKARLAVLQAMDCLRHAEDKYKALGGAL